MYIFSSFSEEFGDEKNLETIKNSVLIPTKNREERKLRINKYLNWVRKITNERRYDPRLATSVFGLNGCLPLNRRKCEACVSGAPYLGKFGYPTVHSHHRVTNVKSHTF